MINSTLSALKVCTALIAVILAGCGSTTSEHQAVVQGTVTIDGELAKSGTVTFLPEGKGATAAGVIHEDGSFALRVGQGDLSDPDNSTLPAGKYAATVVVNAPPAAAKDKSGGPPATGARLMADKYADPATSGLEYDVKEGRNVLRIELEGPWANPPQMDTGTENDQTRNGADGTSTPVAEEPNPQTSNEERASSPGGESVAEPEDSQPSAANESSAGEKEQQ